MRQPDLLGEAVRGDQKLELSRRRSSLRLVDALGWTTGRRCFPLPREGPSGREPRAHWLRAPGPSTISRPLQWVNPSSSSWTTRPCAHHLIPRAGIPTPGRGSAAHARSAAALLGDAHEAIPGPRRRWPSTRPTILGNRWATTSRPSPDSPSHPWQRVICQVECRRKSTRDLPKTLIHERRGSATRGRGR